MSTYLIDLFRFLIGMSVSLKLDDFLKVGQADLYNNINLQKKPSSNGIIIVLLNHRQNMY